MERADHPTVTLQWSRFDNATDTLTAVGGEISLQSRRRPRRQRSVGRRSISVSVRDASGPIPPSRCRYTPKCRRVAAYWLRPRTGCEIDVDAARLILLRAKPGQEGRPRPARRHRRECESSVAAARCHGPARHDADRGAERDVAEKMTSR